MAAIEYKVGSESHSSNWGKFYVKGLEKWEVREGGERDRHHSYAELVAPAAPDRQIFTVFSQKGDKRGTQEFDFYICEARDDTASNQIHGGCYGREGKCEGNFMILCHGEGKIRAPRLMEWWQKLNEKCTAHKEESGLLKKGTKRNYALWCAQHIEKRGLADVPPLPLDPAAEANRRPGQTD